MSLVSSARPQHAEEPQHRPDGEAPRVGKLVRVVRASSRAPVEEQGQAGAEGHQGQQDADPSGELCQPDVDGVADRAELLAPQRQGEQDAERDEADGPQVAGLDPPERRARRLGLLRAGRRLLGGTGGRTRRGTPTGLGHHSEVEITA